MRERELLHAGRSMRGGGIKDGQEDRKYVGVCWESCTRPFGRVRFLLNKLPPQRLQRSGAGCLCGGNAPTVVARLYSDKSRKESGMLAWIIFLIVASAAVSFIPAVISSRRHSPHKLAVGAISWIVFGLSFFGWIGSFFASEMVLSMSQSDRETGGSLSVVVGVFLILGFLLWIVGMIWAFTGRGNRVVPSGPARFKVAGVDRATQMDTTWYCQADSEANARVKADMQGIVVTAVEREV
jgi:hypothetical protein